MAKTKDDAAVAREATEYVTAALLKAIVGLPDYQRAQLISVSVQCGNGTVYIYGGPRK